MQSHKFKHSQHYASVVTHMYAVFKYTHHPPHISDQPPYWSIDNRHLQDVGRTGHVLASLLPLCINLQHAQKFLWHDHYISLSYHVIIEVSAYQSSQHYQAILQVFQSLLTSLYTYWGVTLTAILYLLSQ